MAFTKLLRNLLRDKGIGERIVPIIPDEARTFGMDPLFKEVGIYSALGQLYDPVDSNLCSRIARPRTARCSRRASPRPARRRRSRPPGAYATHGEPMIPFYIFYSMFGFQRTGDELWAFADARGARLPAGRHGRPHDTQRRRSAARGRPLARARLGHPQRAHL